MSDDEMVKRVAAAMEARSASDPVNIEDIARAAIEAVRMSDELQHFTTEELAEDAFLKEELYQAHRIMNTPTDFEERKRAFVAMAKAREDAALARAALERRLSVTKVVPEAQKTL